jgi:hypothetical protein
MLSSARSNAAMILVANLTRKGRIKLSDSNDAAGFTNVPAHNRHSSSLPNVSRLANVRANPHSTRLCSHQPLVCGTETKKDSLVRAYCRGLCTQLLLNSLRGLYPCWIALGGLHGVCRMTVVRRPRTQSTRCIASSCTQLDWLV